MKMQNNCKKVPSCFCIANHTLIKAQEELRKPLHWKNIHPQNVALLILFMFLSKIDPLASRLKKRIQPEGDELHHEEAKPDFAAHRSKNEKNGEEEEHCPSAPGEQSIRIGRVRNRPNDHARNRRTGKWNECIFFAQKTATKRLSEQYSGH
jgi:hypothetical protein